MAPVFLKFLSKRLLKHCYVGLRTLFEGPVALI